jgi:O-antigen/teichoic acid export membrane protein
MIKKIKDKTYNFLRWSQKYTGTDNVYLIKNGFWLTLGQIISMGASLLLSIAFANLVSPVIYGNYKYIISILGILGIFSLSGMSTAVTQAVARGFEGSFYSGFKTKLKWGCLGSITAIIGAVYYWIRGNEILPIPLILIAVFLPLMQSSGVYSSFLSGKKLFCSQVKYSVITNAISSLAIFLVLLITKNLFWLIATYLISHTILNSLFYLLTKNKFLPNKKEDFQTISYGKHLSLIETISIIAEYIDKVLLFTLIGSSQLAIYSFAIIIPEQINGFLKNISTLSLPKLSTKSRIEIKNDLIKKIKKIAIIIIIILIIYWIASPYIYKCFFPKYTDSIHYSQLFMLSIIAVLTSFMITAFQSQMMKKELYLTKISGLIQIFLLIILIPFFGIWGAITAMLSSKILNFFFVLILFARRF